MMRFAAARLVLGLALPLTAPAAEVLPPAQERYAAPDTAEVPDFQRHVLPLMGRLGCNGRACHGSFQGQGGFRLSLFGYDFNADHEALLAQGEDRVAVEAPELSLILRKPTLEIPHKGGKRLAADTWAYRLLSRWIEAGARPASHAAAFERLEVSPREIVFHADGQTVPLRVLAHWSDGSVEDVTCLTRFRTNDEAIAEVDENGVVTSKGQGDTHVVAFYDNGVTPVAVLRPVSDKTGPDYPDVPTPTRIDELIVAKLRKLGIVPSELCTDAEFLRRVSLDMTGTLPTPEEIQAFLAQDDPQKRARKVDELLSRPTYAAWWTNKLCDFLGNSARNFQGLPANTLMAQRWYEWMYRRIAENRPYDELVAGIVLGTSRKPGQSYAEFVQEESAYFRATDPADITARETMPYFWARRNLRQPEEKPLGFSYAFLGVRLECAQCHKHPFDQWTQDDFKRFQAFFSLVRYGGTPDYNQMLRELREELGWNNRPQNVNIQRELTNLLSQDRVVPWQELTITRAPRGDNQRARRGAESRIGRVLGGEETDLSSFDDPRQPLMDWLRSPENPYFAKAFINRVWAGYFGIGIIHPPDDMNLANPPSNDPLLEYLAREFLARRFDMKWLHREIALSAAYQRSWRTNETNRLDERNFSRALVRRLPAEVLLDAAAQATAGSRELARVTTEIADRSFGPVQGTGGAGRRGNDYAGRVFGRAGRDTNCDCSRSDEPNLLQAIYLENDPELLALLDRSDGWISEVAGPRRAAADAGDRRDRARRIAELEARLAALRNRNTKDDADIQRVEARLAELRTAAPEAAPLDPDRSDDLITEAYLRTLSRLPTAHERATVRAYFENSPDRAAGLRGLLWALLNTKEFITNH